jgi:hypothetical protein
MPTLLRLADLGHLALRGLILEIQHIVCANGREIARSTLG